MPSRHKRYRYNHMLPGDQIIWDRYLEQYGDYFEGFTYDEHVGEGVGDLAGYPPEIARAAKLLTQKRIDAVGRRGSEVWIFEIKPRAGLSAVGQVLAYKTLWEIGHRPEVVYRTVIVTDRASYDMRAVVEAQGIQLREVG